MAGSLIQTLGAQEGLRGPERFPSGGLEKRFDSFLKGKNGALVSFRTPKGRLDDFKIIKKPQDGSDLYLTIHPLIQTVVEEQLKNAVELAEAKGGWAIMMDPYTGALMSLAQYPQLDLLDPSKLLDDPIKKEYLQMKCLTDPFEPGSIIKPFTMLTCLKANRVLVEKKQSPCFFPSEKMACLDGRFPGRKNPIKDVHAYNFLDMQMALQKSSNIYMAKSIHKVIQALGDDFYAKTLKEMCDFGKKTTLNLGAESSGFVPTPHKKTKTLRPEWSTPTPYSLAMGYNLLATSLQMTKAFAMIANGGFLVEPYLVEKIVKKQESGIDEVLFDQALIPKKKITKIDEEDCSLVKMAMRYALMPGGTAFRARIPGYSCAGKTATTEKLSGGFYSKDRHISTFVGFAPVEKPRFVLLIVIDEPKKKIIPNVGKNQFGGVCAAPSFAIIGQKALEILGEPQDDPGALETFSQSKFSQEHKNLENLFKSWNH
jgi:cell division protein FtsI (penicillin-binding protein 3)